MAARAGIIVTGTEVLTGRVTDRNGPWIAQRLRELGVDLAHTVVVGDRVPDITSALRFMAAEGLSLIVTSGGLGPTADDLTTATVAAFQGRALELDERLEARIGEIVAPLLRRWPNVDQEALAAGTRKQAEVPAGAAILEPVGTAPGVVVPPAEPAGPTVLVLPGPPRELQPMWQAAVQTPELQSAIAGATVYEQRTLRLFGIPESEIAETLRRAAADGIELDQLEITTCLKRGEVEVVTRYEPPATQTYERFARFVAERHGAVLFSPDGRTVDELVAATLIARSLTVATAESCTAGLLAARLTELPGSSAYFVGGLLTYSNESKEALAGVAHASLAEQGAVSEQVAVELARGARERLGCDLAVSVTGIAGPDGGSDEKPVGTVWFAVADAAGEVTRTLRLPGGRADVRDRATTIALHMLRARLAG
jgi:nicotinamide-nucleotide amidase